MNLRRAFWILAAINTGVGALLAVGAIAFGVGVVLTAGMSQRTMSAAFAVVSGFLALSILVLALSLLNVAVRHFRDPRRASAIGVGASSAFIIWLQIGSWVKFAGVTGFLSSGIFAIGSVIAYLCYRLVLKPAALRAFP